jgi:hypothetical protein
MGRRKGVVYEMKRYFFRRRRRWRRVPRQLIGDYDITGATQDERLLMMYGVARSPDEAKRLMKKYRALDAMDCLDKLPRRARRGWWGRLKYKMLLAIRTLEGHDPRNPYALRGDDNEIDLVYVYRGHNENHQPE